MDVPQRGTGFGGVRSYGSVAQPATPPSSLVTERKRSMRFLRLRNVATGILFAVTFAALIGICANQIFTDEISVAAVPGTVDVGSATGEVWDHLIHFYHTDRKVTTNYDGDCAPTEGVNEEGLKECYLKCKGDRGCKSFTFDMIEKECCGSTSYEPGYAVSGHKNWYQMQVLGPGCEVVKVYSNSMRTLDTSPPDWGDVSASLPGCARLKTMEACMAKCVASDQCVAFNYARNGGMCCGSTSKEPGKLGMGVDLLVLPTGNFENYNPARDCSLPGKDVTAGGTASLQELFAPGKNPQAEGGAKKTDGASVASIAARVASSAADAASDSGSLNEFMKELFPEKFGLQVGVDSVNVADAPKPTSAPASSTVPPAAAAAGTPPVSLSATASNTVLRQDNAAPASAAAAGAGVQRHRHVHGEVAQAQAHALASPKQEQAPAKAAKEPEQPAMPAAMHSTAAASQRPPLPAAATPAAPVPAAPTGLPAAAAPVVSAFRQQQQQQPKPPTTEKEALAQAKEILAKAEKQAEALIASVPSH